MVAPQVNGYNSKDMKLLQYQLNASVEFLKNTTQTGISKDEHIQKAIDKSLLETLIYISCMEFFVNISYLKPEEEEIFCKCHHALLDMLSNVPLTDAIRKQNYTFALKYQQVIGGS